MSNQQAIAPIPFRGVAFDLLTALIDSWSLWISVAKDDELGRRWRRESLHRVTAEGVYRSYENIVRDATRAVGLDETRADELLERWASGELRPWPEASNVLDQGASHGLRTAVVTNCSQRLAEAAAEATGHRFDAIVSAERAGMYKTDPRAYRAGLRALGNFAPAEVLFVAGSAHDVPGATAVGMPVYWSNRFHDKVPSGSPAPLVTARDLNRLPTVLAAGRVQ